MGTNRGKQPAKATGLAVRRQMCGTCIYRPESPFLVEKLEDGIRDPHGDGYRTYRACHTHHGDAICCAGFWTRHRDEFTTGQIAERLNMVRYIDDPEQADVGGVRRRCPRRIDGRAAEPWRSTAQTPHGASIGGWTGGAQVLIRCLCTGGITGAPVGLPDSTRFAHVQSFPRVQGGFC